MATRPGLFYLQVHIPERLKAPLKSTAAAADKTLQQYVAEVIEAALEVDAQVKA